MTFSIRKAKKQDSKEILRLIEELAVFEKLNPPDTKAQKRIIRDGFGTKPKFEIYLALKEKVAVGYAFYFFTYSTFLARPTLYLEDIYVSENYRKSGVGKMLFDKLIETAKRKNCGRIEFIVLDWNTTAQKFYKKYGVEEMKNWKFFRKTL